ncbi:hypothetical protein DM02DRAFT_616413 [Periconia macrospinosa]|uniref:1-alkyl-2-acetylglycerophosphocholine esterase n=1 Tax=Periconia macrospinosa TaxID=97972 RepID=A0A2V1DHI4_9PLEO|nr:hypothetical protein DM02DRAFT_616413 [Periconia macrospinosa]
MYSTTLALLATLTATASSVSLPPPSGPYGVGYTQHVFFHVTPNDPTPGSGNELLASIYYPTLSAPSLNTSVPYFDPISAPIWGEVFNLYASDLLSLTTSLQWQATPLTPSEAASNNVSALPTLIFGPGGGMNAFMYSSLLSDLASKGYTVIAYDHPGEAPYLTLPYNVSGGGVVGWDIYMPYNDSLIQAIYEFRRNDMLFLLSHDGFPSLVEQYGTYFNTSSYGAFGHSTGAAAAAGSMDRLESIIAGVHIDGGLFGDSVDAKLNGRPYLMMMNDVHFESDTTWPGFVERYKEETEVTGKGWLDWTTVNGAKHLAFSDIPLWVELLPKANGTDLVDLGIVKGTRMDKLVKKYVGAFWGWVSGGAYDEVLDGVVKEWPEVVYNETIRGV